MKKKYYVYEIKDKTTNQFYIGSRGCYCVINDDKYLGSPKTWKPNKKKLIKQIIKTFDTREEAIIFERQLIINSISDSLNMNFSIPNVIFHRENLVTAKDKNGKVITISKDDPLFGVEYFGVSKGLVLVKDNNGDCFLTSLTDPRYISGELVHNNKGKNLGEDHPNYNKIWINNGVKQKLINPDKILSGWVLGTLQKGKHTYSSHKNSIWVNKDNDNKRINSSELDEYLIKGWVKGRVNLKKYSKNINKKIITPNLKNYRWINKDNQNKRINEIELDEYLIKGWVKGRTKLCKKQKHYT